MDKIMLDLVFKFINIKTHPTLFVFVQKKWVFPELAFVMRGLYWIINNVHYKRSESRMWFESVVVFH